MAVALVLVVALVAVVAGLSRDSLIAAPSSSASDGSSSPVAQQASTQTSPADLKITKMFLIVLSGSFQPPSSNSTTINGNQTAFKASAGTTFTVDVNVEYIDCYGNSCPAEITSVSVAPASFTVEAITVVPPNSGAGLPALVSLTSGTRWDCNFIVTITAPPTPYNGPLTLTAQAA